VLRPDGRRSTPDKNSPLVWGKAHVSGNVVAGDEAVSADNWNGGVQIENAPDLAAVTASVKVAEPFPMAPVPTQPAAEAYQAVLANVGATLPKRDAVDQRIINQVRGGKPLAATKDGIITSIDQVGGYPTYQGEPIADADRDGLPDDWERAHGFDPSSPADASLDAAGDGYTNLERYLNGIDPRRRIDWTDLKNNRDPLQPTP
jgi:hypothetical protein